MNVVAPTFDVLSVCSGGGGLDLGVKLAVPGARTVCYVENEVTAAAVLVKNMEAGGLDDAPVWTDLRTFDGAAWRGLVDCVIGGYPCQPFSNAGKRLGADDPRHLWPAVERIVRDVGPRLCFFENVGAHLRLGFREVAGSLHALGYEVAAVLLTAEEVGAPHGRERLFIMAHREGVVQREPHDEGRAESWSDARGDAGGDSGTVADPGDGLVPLAGRRPQGRDGTGSAGTDAQLADTERGSGSAEPREQHHERAEVVARAGAVGDTDGVGRRTQGHGGEPPELAYQAERPFLWPPGPQDTDGWQRVLAVRPDLAPAVLADVDTGLVRSELGRALRSLVPGRNRRARRAAARRLADALAPLAAKAASQSRVRNLVDGVARGSYEPFAAAAMALGLDEFEADEAWGDWIIARESGELSRADQLHILGNGVVPQQAATAFALLAEALDVTP